MFLVFPQAALFTHSVGSDVIRLPKYLFGLADGEKQIIKFQSQIRRTSHLMRGVDNDYLDSH